MTTCSRRPGNYARFRFSFRANNFKLLPRLRGVGTNQQKQWALTALGQACDSFCSDQIRLPSDVSHIVQPLSTPNLPVNKHCSYTLQIQIGLRHWTFFFYISWYSSLEEQDRTADCTDAQRLDQVKGFSRTFTDPLKSAFEWASADCKVWYSCLHDFDPGAAGNRWGTLGGRVTLAGDSAHTMTYQRGQGLNHSVTDAAKLCEAILKYALAEILEQSWAMGIINEHQDLVLYKMGI
ncbi:hypothetical protein BDBG_16580 [Blastomyces gilchristii SLH14081]|uniref:FAD-binding domain-containing protein n=1 Tax=Blastomyces gilchristii (strain SLH14081) TaxID=559298 RepID=A0A179UDY2_BLAGS|nr:uncharacterized protein BDBG_16580 [Blastomyces gilchristii SLH14081]OAT06226.1 hypothetical protein BDBG_16580 [Blastomyces gilchristii SLH14081]